MRDTVLIRLLMGDTIVVDGNGEYIPVEDFRRAAENGLEVVDVLDFDFDEIRKKFMGL